MVPLENCPLCTIAWIPGTERQTVLYVLNIHVKQKAYQVTETSALCACPRKVRFQTHLVAFGFIWQPHTSPELRSSIVSPFEQGKNFKRKIFYKDLLKVRPTSGRFITTADSGAEAAVDAQLWSHVGRPWELEVLSDPVPVTESMRSANY